MHVPQSTGAGKGWGDPDCTPTPTICPLSCPWLRVLSQWGGGQGRPTVELCLEFFQGNLANLPRADVRKDNHRSVRQQLSPWLRGFGRKLTSLTRQRSPGQPLVQVCAGLGGCRLHPRNSQLLGSLADAGGGSRRGAQPLWACFLITKWRYQSLPAGGTRTLSGCHGSLDVQVPSVGRGTTCPASESRGQIRETRSGPALRDTDLSV